MRIYSMTATFGKLERETLTLEPGLNIVTAPNEWGKSTWCAFLTAMLYGIETRQHTTGSVLADKDRYAPWSGSPMSGRIELCWQDRDITIERHTKGRIPLGEFSAYETLTGIPVPELTASNCGAMLLGVEKSVFIRCAFLRGSDLAVTQDENLRRRLNALVTTGDETGTGAMLERKLKELKNRCRSNRTTGLLPQVGVQKEQLEQKLSYLEGLETQCQDLQVQLKRLQNRQSDLENHRQTLEYAADQQTKQQYADSLAAQEAAAQQEALFRERSEGLLPLAEIEQQLQSLQTLCSQQEGLQAQLRQLPALEEKDWSLAARDSGRYRTAKRAQHSFTVLGLLAIGVGVGVVWLLEQLLYGCILGGIGLICLVISIFMGVRKRRLLTKYAPLPPEQWIPSAREHEQIRIQRYSLEELLEHHTQEIQNYIGDTPGDEYVQQLQESKSVWLALEDARWEHRRAEQMASALKIACRDIAPPARPDELSYSLSETQELLTGCANRIQQLQLQLGSCQGQMEAFGHPDQVRQELHQVIQHIAKLEDTYMSLELAQKALASASEELQRRYAPKIAKRAQEIVSRLTDGRYHRLILDSELQLSTAASGENILRSALWRSEGTVDQLYLALRLAVAEELTPHSPLILDDALVRFDDERLRKVLQVLQQESEQKQILLFTCSSREENMLK